MIFLWKCRFSKVSWKVVFGCQERPKSAQKSPKRPHGRLKRTSLGVPRAAREPKMPPGQREAQERPWSPTGSRPKGNRQEETRADKTRGERIRVDQIHGRTRQQIDKKTVPIHEGRVHFTRRQLTSRAFNARVHSSISIYV